MHESLLSQLLKRYVSAWNVDDRSCSCCSVLQCAAVCCSVLQCVAVCCSVLQCFAVCCSADVIAKDAHRYQDTTHER